MNNASLLAQPSDHEVSDNLIIGVEKLNQPTPKFQTEIQEIDAGDEGEDPSDK